VEDVFWEEDDYRLFLDVLNETIKQWNLEVAAYCLMSNHYHILVRTPEGNISRCMRHLNGVYTQRFNRRHGIDGTLFRGRYKSVLVEEDSHLLELLRYIHRNPIKAQISPSLEDYPWSSHKGYLAGNRGWTWLMREPLLAMFSKQRKKAYSSYLDFVQQQDSEEIETFFSKQKQAPIFGSGSFVEKIKAQFEEGLTDVEIPESGVLNVSFDDVVAAVCQVCDVPLESIYHSRRGHQNIARDLVLYSMRMHSRQTLFQIGRNLRIKKYSAVSSAVQRIKRQLKTDRSLCEIIEKIDNNLIKAKTRFDP
jgi:putative transposase